MYGVHKPEKLLKPLHLSIADLIKTASTRELECLGKLILGIITPKGHDEIINAWNIRKKELNWLDYEMKNVITHLLEQKQLFADKSINKNINLDELQQEAEKLLNLLKDRQLGLMS